VAASAYNSNFGQEAFMARIDQIRSYLEKLAASIWQGAEMDAHGRIVIRRGSANVEISATENYWSTPLVTFTSTIATGVPDTPALFSWLNDQNNRTALVKVLKRADQVQAYVFMLADYIDESQLTVAVRLIGAFADQIDDQLVATYGGQLPSPPDPAGGS
jgi:hypothetical protein